MITEPEFKKIFDADFKAFKRFLKERGVYKQIMVYLFSHEHKTVNDLYNSIVKACKSEEHEIYPTFTGIRSILGNVRWLGFINTNFTDDDLQYWETNISRIRYDLMQATDVKFITDNAYFLII